MDEQTPVQPQVTPQPANVMPDPVQPPTNPMPYVQPVIPIPQNPTMSVPQSTKSKTTAWILGVLITGVGHLYLGEKKRGGMFLGIVVAWVIVGTYISVSSPSLGTLVRDGGSLVWAYSLFDLSRQIKKMGL